MTKPSKPRRRTLFQSPQGPVPVPPAPQPFYSPSQAPAVPRSLNIRIQLISDPHVTAAEAQLLAGNDYMPLLVKTGWSIRDNADTYDEEAGVELAAGRALLALGHALCKVAAGRVKHADSVRAHKAELKARAQKPAARHAAG